MKKKLSQPDYIKRNTAVSNKSIRKKRRIKEYIKRRNLLRNIGGRRPNHKGISYSENIVSDRFWDFTKIPCPENLTLITNSIDAQKFIRFINRIRKCYDTDKKVFVEMENVKNIDYDAIVILLSMLVRFKSKGLKFNGSFPSDIGASTILKKSGFFDCLYNKRVKDAERYEIGKDNNYFHTHAWKNVDPVLCGSLIAKSSSTIWGEKKRYKGAYRALIEIMQNTNNHATPNKEGDKHWWLSVKQIPEQNKVCFSFIDYGVGIFKSLDNKPEGNKFHGWIEKLKKIATFENNADVLRLILSGEFHASVTGKSFRGKGLPGIGEAQKRNQLSNLHIISNSVYSDVSNNTYEILNESLTGTFIYWELNQNNEFTNG